jgi:protein-disulfide isomerase
MTTSDTAVARQLAVPSVSDFAVCVRSSRTEQLIKDQKRLGDSLGVRATPALITPQSIHVGAFGEQDLKRLLDGG